MSATLTINCTKPGCSWSGPPAEAPGHPCPVAAEEPEAETAADQPAGPFAGMTGADGIPIEGTVDPEHRYAVVWADGQGTTVTVGTAEDEEGALKIVEMTEAGKGTVEIVDRKPIQELVALGAEEESAEPTTREELEAWLLANGDYDDAGVPQNEETAKYDARLGVLLEEAGTEPEPDLDEISETIEGEPVPVEPVAEVVAANEVEEQEDPEPELEVEIGEVIDAVEDAVREEVAANLEGEPWELQIAAVLETQTAVKDYRWLLISKADDGTVELIGRARVKSDAEELLVATESEGQLPGLEIVKTTDVLKAAAEIQERRRLVPPEPEAEPAPEAPQEPQEPAQEPAEAEEAPEVEEPAPAAEEPGGAPAAAGALFDAEAFKDPSLQIPRVDGQEIQKIALDFSGGVMLDRSKAADVELYNRFRLFKDLELWISVKSVGTAAKGATNREGELDVVVGRKSVKVESVRVVAPEELKGLSGLEAFRAGVRIAGAAGVGDDDLFHALETMEADDA